MPCGSFSLATATRSLTAVTPTTWNWVDLGPLRTVPVTPLYRQDAICDMRQNPLNHCPSDSCSKHQKCSLKLILDFKSRWCTSQLFSSCKNTKLKTDSSSCLAFAATIYYRHVDWYWARYSTCHMPFPRTSMWRGRENDVWAPLSVI